MFSVNTIVKINKFPEDSFYKQAYGIITKIHSNGYIDVNVLVVKDKWSKTFERHPGFNSGIGCHCSVKENVLTEETHKLMEN